ncbi:MAG: OmpA family protein, partial [Spirochaetia bacterium]
GDIRIVLTGELKGNKRLAFTLSYGGQTLNSGVVSLKGHLRSKAVWLILPAALAAAGIILFMTLPPRGAVEEAPEEVETVKQEPAEEEASAEAAGPEEDDAMTEAAEAVTEQTEAEQTRESAGEITVETGEEEAPSREAPPEEPPPAAPVTETVTVYFEPNRSRLIDEARETLDNLLSLLEEFEELSVRIEGHCALRGSESGRIELSNERSAAVRRYLRDAGWDPEGAVEVEGFGGRRPATLSEEDQYLNRRAEITVTYIP